MEKDESREPQEDDAQDSEDLEVSGEEAEEVVGGRKAGGHIPETG